MKVQCAGPKAANVGRYYYKCPLNIDHDFAFHWCDEYHEVNTPGFTPQYVVNQVLKPRMNDEQSASSTSYQHRSQPPQQNQVPSNRIELTIQTAYMFMAMILVLFGIIIGLIIGKLI